MTNVFGERLWIEAADQGAQSAWGGWSMFTIDVRNAAAGNSSVDPTLLLLPILPSSQSGPLQEEVLLVRDEVANMAWGIEKTVPLASGISRPGSEAAKRTSTTSDRWSQQPPPHLRLPPMSVIRQ